jgi:hypothetical protein
VVLTAVKMTMLVLWVVTPSGFLGRYQRFGGTYCIHLQVHRFSLVTTAVLQCLLFLLFYNLSLNPVYLCFLLILCIMFLFISTTSCVSFGVEASAPVHTLCFHTLYTTVKCLFGVRLHVSTNHYSLSGL